MKKRIIILGLSLALLVALTGVTLAAGRGNGSGTSQLDLTDPVTLSGTVEDLTNFVAGESQMNRGAEGSYILFRTSEGKELHLIVGPVWFLDSLKLNLRTGDSISVSGHYEADGDLVVFKITKDGVDYTLRNTEGHPLWAQVKGQTGFGSKNQNSNAPRGPANEFRGNQNQTCNQTCPYCVNP